LTIVLALTFTAAITTYAVSKGRSPVAWGGASLSITVGASVLMWAVIRAMDVGDIVFDSDRFGLVMLAVIAEPVLAIVGNLVLVSRLAALPVVLRSDGSSWMMWRVADEANDGCACRLSLTAEAIVGTAGGEALFSIAHADLSELKVDGETLLLRAGDGEPLRLVLAHGDPHDRSARIDEIAGIKRAIERGAQSAMARVDAGRLG
jgi:hypothetical protein